MHCGVGGWRWKEQQLFFVKPSLRCHLVFPRGAASKDVGGLFNQGLLQRSGTGNDYQEAPVASEIGTADNVPSDGCKI